MGLPLIALASRGSHAATIMRTLRRAGWEFALLGSTSEALPHGARAIVVDPDALGETIDSLCDRARNHNQWQSLPVLVVGEARVEGAVAALRSAAIDYLDRAAGPEEFSTALARALRTHAIRAFHSSPASEPETYPELLGNSGPMAQLRARIEQAARSDATALLVGETGTGKELVARLVHQSSLRRGGPFVIVSCASIPPTLAESELFGHVKGAFSGATSAHRGLIPAAQGGTLFIDGVGALPLELQAKLLRVLQERCVRPVGAELETPTDFRLVVSSAVHLEELVRQGMFREDLYYRLAVLEMEIPPLRDRGTDVLLLAERFLHASALDAGKRVVGLTPAAEDLLLRHSWPGNVRELKNCIEYAVAVTRYDRLGCEVLPDSVIPPSDAVSPVEASESRWEAAERRHIEAVLLSVGGNRSQAALLLGIDRKTLHRKLQRLEIDVPVRTGSGTRRRVDGEAVEAAHSSRYRFSFR